MAVDPKQKALVKARERMVRRQAIEEQIKELESNKAQLGEEIIALLDQAGETRITSTKGGPGYVLQKPTQIVYNEERLAERLKESAPKVARECFKKVTQFNKKAFERALEHGLIPGADELLADDDIVTISALKPRLMPLKANADKSA